MTFRSSDLQNPMRIMSNSNFSSPMKHLSKGLDSQRLSSNKKFLEMEVEEVIRTGGKPLDMKDGTIPHLNNMQEPILKINSNIGDNSKILDLFT